MCSRARKFDVAHTLTTNLGERDFNATLFTDDTAMLQALVFATQAFVVLGRSKDTRAEQSVPFRFERTVVDGLGLFHFAKRPGTNHLRGCQTNAQRVELVRVTLSL